MRTKVIIWRQSCSGVKLLSLGGVIQIGRNKTEIGSESKKSAGEPTFNEDVGLHVTRISCYDLHIV